MLVFIITTLCYAVFGLNDVVLEYPLYSNGSCNATASTQTNCSNSHNFAVNINGQCYPSDVKKGCYFVYNCICNGTIAGYQFTGYWDNQCKGKEVAIHTVPINTCQADHSACDGPNDPPDGYFVNFATDQFLLCCPECKNVTQHQSW